MGNTSSGPFCYIAVVVLQLFSSWRAVRKCTVSVRCAPLFFVFVFAFGLRLRSSLLFLIVCSGVMKSKNTGDMVIDVGTTCMCCTLSILSLCHNSAIVSIINNTTSSTVVAVAVSTANEQINHF